MQPLRLLMTADTVGGVWTYALELIQSLAPLNYEVLLATMGKPLSPSQRREVRHISNLTVCESAYKLEWMHEPWAEVDASGEWLMELTARFSPHLVHLNTYSHGVLPWGVPTLMVGHSCVYSWWYAVKHERPPVSWRTYDQRVQRGLQRADMVIAPSQSMLTALTRHYGLLRQTEVIYNGRRAEHFHVAPKEQLVLTMGRLWDEAKNISVLEQVAPHIAWPIYVAGEQQHPDGEHLQVRNLRALGRLEQSEVRAWLAKASIYALPARYEPFGLSALEAALSGCALVLGEIESLQEVWGDAAIYVPPDDADALTDVLGDLICRPKLRTQLAQRAGARAMRYGAAEMAHAYHHVYHRIYQRAYRRAYRPALSNPVRAQVVAP